MHGHEFSQRLHSIELSHRKFGVRNDVSSRSIDRYCTEGAVVPGRAARLLQLEELCFALSLLIATSGERVSKRRMAGILKIAQPVSNTLPPQHRAKVRKRYPKNLLRLIPKLPPAPPAPAPKPDWQVNIERIGYAPNHAAVQKALLLRRPNPPRGGPDDGEEPSPLVRVTRPI
jgi:hypothetical protein